MRESKYTPLQRHLTNLPDRRWNASFDEIEQILGFTLPATASSHPEWWGNEDPQFTKHTQCKAWMSIGWTVSDIDLASRTVRFQKG
ncbi:MAG: DUF7662 domain-containing protein [Alphaproteobacteria bacterium]